ncbi:alginate export family protein [Luteimonas sp. MC1572]|uniref:alginate export family protein n=1 Tax=Luteimonas sp. MC1572 TaxID=2799325 RepID=UPI0018F0AA9E|nr:alginate export family protein [Luteimonas sp. MC1572]MBJ6981879.1 alginate export family protein [Luteimonas sp. MC1572]QQO03157.1 alginate export family protein [Luteimonas sp. MC1572]
MSSDPQTKHFHARTRAARHPLAAALLLALFAAPVIASEPVADAPVEADQVEAQAVAPEPPPPAPAAPAPPFRAPNVHMIPWANNYAFLADPAKRTGAAWEKLSYIPVSDRDPQKFLTIGGEFRYYGQYWEHVTNGIAPNDKNDSHQRRTRIYGDLHLGPDFRAFLELGESWEHDAEFPTPNNFDGLDIQQAFVDASFGIGDGHRITFRPGRFQMPLGNGIMVGTRDGTALRYTYDGLRVMLATKAGNKLDVFATRPVAIARGSFDNGPDNGRSFSGVYFSHPTGKGSGVDAYWYNVGHERVAFPGGLVGPQRRHSVGVRAFGRPGRWDYDVEGVLQAGSFAGEDIRAWGFISNGGYTFTDARFAPRLGVRVNAFSGDDDRGQGDLGTFEAPFPRTALHTDAGLFVFMNLVNVHPTVTWAFTDRVRASLGFNAMWRENTNDDIYYGGTGRPLAAVPTRDRHVATSYEAQANWQVNRNLNLNVFLSHIEAGRALEAAGGESGQYYGMWAQYRF